MKSYWHEKTIDYDGSQLRRIFAYENFNLLGNSIISFRGKCDIKKENIKDGEDLFAGEKIYSEDMLHFLIECHDTNLESMIVYQRLFSSLIKDYLQINFPKYQWLRRGDDIFHDERKLNISIATANSLSAMVHCGINISSQNTPVKTIGLQDIGIKDFKVVAKDIMKLWQEDYLAIQEAKSKVFIL